MIEKMLLIYFSSLIIMLVINLIGRKLSNPLKISHYRAAIDRWKELEKKAIETGDQKYLIKYKREEKKMMRLQQEMTKTQAPFLCINLIAMLVFFLILRTIFGNETVALLPVDMSLGGIIPWFGAFNVNIPAFEANFFGWYLIVSTSLLPVRKIFGFK